ncbi:(2Fe-2S) ferredoxin domain-containing protein [Pseudonocardia hispaniensis]|uniref:(2Fe-2S) ferredoxin domain-containing protein n=1 Tax=Pseudonocardia hispaniensis TaxID=904933 RepID=A0ABW1IXK1_9PSEU
MPPPDDRALLLVARPTPAGVDARSLSALAAAVADHTAHPVRIGHLDQAEPSIHSALDEIAADGRHAAMIVGLAIPEDRYLTTWIGRAVANWRETRRHDLDIRVGTALSSLPALAEILAGLGGTDGTPVTAAPSGFRSPAWSILQIPQRHLLVCRGPRCTAYGAGATHRALAEATRGTTTQVTPTGCLGPCNLGPLVIDNPAGHWHQAVDPAAATGIAGAPS